tara:strand:+ start:832 stop:1104 length:273 start_codon:yes stop_codon:yes gene_type:complete
MTEETNSYITIQPNSHYHSAAYNANLCKSHQYLVIDFFAWVKWYNDARFQRRPLVPTPVFAGDTYDAALKVCKELNESIVAAESGLLSNG